MTVRPVKASGLAAFRNAHDGADIVVCGCGQSLRDLPAPRRLITIGVNDVGRLFDPTYLVVVNPRSQFKADRFRYVEHSNARAVFTQTDLGAVHPPVVRFRLGKYGGTDMTGSDTLHYTQNSPYVAVCLAAFMGARRIGLIGVDLTDDHFFARTGRHSLAGRLHEIDTQYRRLAEALAARGVQLVNLSAVSRLTSLTKRDPAAFLDDDAGTETTQSAATPSELPLNVVSYATTPVAGVPAVLARCIAARTSHTARCVWSDCRYGNGVSFDGDIEWLREPHDAEAALSDADIVIVHNGKVDPRHRELLESKPVVTMAHNYAWNVDTSLVQRGWPGLVVAQYQATLDEFARWTPVPNPVPIWEPAFTPGAKPARIALCFTPSGRHERYPPNHRLFWHAKGYDTTMRVLDRLARRHDVLLEVIRSGHVSHAEALAMKRRAHIVIDECVTGSYHRNSLEGLATGCVVVNGVGSLPRMTEVLAACAPNSGPLPFTCCRLEELESTLESLIASGIDRLTARGLENRAWMERHWDFTAQWERFWMPAVRAALDHRAAARRIARDVTSRRPQPMARPVSVVVPHGGVERLPQLTASLAALRQRTGVGEVIVAEMGSTPAAEAVAGRWADKYVFVESGGAFERARALNVGSGLAECELVLWHDNDLIPCPDFIVRAAEELAQRDLHYLVPYSTIRYLAKHDSEHVMIGARDPQECAPVSLLASGGRRPACSGGAGLVRRDFLVQFGGLIEGFVGWGGEDNAWNHKVRLLGRSGVTRRIDQHAWHLFHPSSAGYRGHAPHAHNPHYARNVALLGRICAIEDPRMLMREFPPAAPCPWDRTRSIVALAIDDPLVRDRARAVAHAMRGGYGMNVTEATVSGGNGWHERCATADAVVLFGAGTAGVTRGGAIDAAPPTPMQIPAQADAYSAARMLIGPLSLVLANGTAASERSMSAPRTPSPLRAPQELVPVWTYWEGACPDWIQACRKTIAAHARDVRMLTPTTFDALWDTDRDIDLTSLAAPQRADFVRAFLLKRYGGLWIDADCIVMQPLAPLLDLVREHGFIAHRERSGLVSNGFIGASAGSRCASLFYDRLCHILRSKQPIGWTTLGSEPLTAVLNSTHQWHELRCELVQPICWSNPGAFFTRASTREHQRRLDARAICYMLSNTQIAKFMQAHKGRRLVDGATFFTFLVNGSLQRAQIDAPRRGDRQSDIAEPNAELEPLREIFAGFVNAYRRYGDESMSGPGSCLSQTAELRERIPLLLADLDLGTLLDAPCGDFNWMRYVNLGRIDYVGIDILPDIIAENQRRYGTVHRRFVCGDIRTTPVPDAECILCRDCLPHLSFADIRAILRTFARSSAAYLLTTTFTAHGPNADTCGGAWRPLNLEMPPFNFPKPVRLINEKCSEAGGAYRDKHLALWTLDSIRALL